jgi:hypothetical protein
VEDHTLHGKIRFKRIMKKLDGVMLTNLAQYSNRWPVSMGMNLWFPHMGNFRTSYRPISFPKNSALWVPCGMWEGS